MTDQETRDRLALWLVVTARRACAFGVFVWLADPPMWGSLAVALLLTELPYPRRTDK